MKKAKNHKSNRKMKNAKLVNTPDESRTPVNEMSFGDGSLVLPEVNHRNSLDREIKKHIQQIEDHDRCIHYLMGHNQKMEEKVKRYEIRMADVKEETEVIQITNVGIREKFEKLDSENKEAHSLHKNIRKLLEEELMLKNEIEKLERIRRILAVKSDDIDGFMTELFPDEAYGTGLDDIKTLRSQTCISECKDIQRANKNRIVIQAFTEKKGRCLKLRKFFARVFRRRN
ncbi:hypothetical protein SNE40_005829 [Patella caerulea]|uniref:Uncharacterized protein n=1 Tax=Patella caerulea TaxID=87958 RepID=A0AAN8K2F1_PATCE